MAGSEVMLKKIEQVENILKFSNDNILGIINKYEILASIENGKTDEDVFYSNKDIYAVILLPIVYRTLYNVIDSEVYKKHASSVPNIDRILRSINGRDKFFATYGNKLLSSGVSMNEMIDISEGSISQLLSTFGIDEAKDLDGADILGDLITDDEDEDEEFDFDDIDLDMTDDGESTYSDGTETVEIPIDKLSEEELQIEKLREVWGDKLESVVQGIMASYRKLYESGYGLVSPCGILTNIGIVRSKTDGQIGMTGNKAVDMEVFRAITAELRTGYNLYAQNGKEPDIEEIESASEPIIYTDMHIKFMFGHLNFCKGKYGLREYLTRKCIKNDSTVKVLKYSDISGWIQETVERYFYEAYIKYGVTTNATEKDSQLTNKINVELSKNLKNVIVVAERKKGVNTRIRICSDDSIDVERLIGTIENKLNIGTSKNIRVKQIGDYSCGVVDLNVIYNEKKYSQDALFAYQVLDILEEQGIKPSWDNVILGKKDDGTIMTYNFKDKRNPVYAIYASSRSGKGVMTLNLIVSALADRCKLLYNDGKPDMGSVLADAAWKDGLDACVYNGVAGKGTELLENRGTCIRNIGPFSDVDSIPNGIFITKAEKERFMLITTYLRGIQLICELAADRASKGLPGDDWVVAFVDECEQASIAEIEVRNCLERAETERKAAKDEDGKKIDLTKDPAYKFIQEYKRWLSIIQSNFKTCVTSTFGYANMTTFFIWQSTKFPEKYKNGSTVASVIDSASGNITKIVGRGAAVNYGSSVFGTPSSLKDAKWYDERFSGANGGFFAIGKNVQSNSMAVFRPFNVYSDANNKELILENAKAVGLTEEDLKGVSLARDGSVIKEVGFEGYANKLLSRYGMNVAQQLNVGYVYADERVRALGLADNLNEYMYDCHSFNKTADSEEDNSGYTSGYRIEDTEEGSLDFGVSDVDFSMSNDEDYSDDVDSDFEEEYDDIEMDIDMGSAAGNAMKAKQFSQGFKDVKAARERMKSDNLFITPDIESQFGDINIKMNANGSVEVSDYSGLEVIELSSQNYIESDKASKGYIDTFKNKMMDNMYGVNYQFKQRWRCVLNSISNAFARDNMVIRFGVFTDSVIANGRIVNITSMIDDGYGIYLEDIVNFKEAFKKFKEIKELQLDEESFRWLVREYGVGAGNIRNVFVANPRLAKISIVGRGMETTVIERNNYGASSRYVDRKSDEAEFRQQIEQTTASYNKNLSNKGVGYNNRVASASFGFTKDSWTRAKRDLSSGGKKGIAKGMFWVGASAVVGTIGAVVWGGGKLFSIFKK